jgi:hypothetical protein
MVRGVLNAPFPAYWDDLLQQRSAATTIGSHNGRRAASNRPPAGGYEDIERGYVFTR